MQPLFSSDSDPKITLDVLLKYFNDKLAKHKSVEHDIEQWEKTRVGCCTLQLFHIALYTMLYYPVIPMSTYKYTYI